MSDLHEFIILLKAWCVLIKTFTIHLIRHGITEGNIEGKYIGSTDLPLCDAGRNILSELKNKYKYPTADVYFSSPMKRCTETMRILYPDKQPALIPDLRECDFGIFEGRTSASLKDDPEFEHWVKGGVSAAPPGGESGEAFSHRIAAAFSDIVIAMMKTDIRSAVICTHGGVVATILTLFGIPQKEITEWMTKDGCGYTIRTDLTSWMRGNVFEVVSSIPEGMENISIKPSKGE